MTNISTNQLRWLWLSLFIFLLDQASKIFVYQHLAFNQPLVLLPIFNLNFATNLGAAFNFLGSASGWQRWLFVAIALVISAVILRWLYQLPKKNNWAACAMALVLGGALGNLFDRLTRGYVIDFIQVHYKDWYFPTFNLADSAITVGVIIWLAVAAKKI
jgi:signal peptidase II